MTIIDILNSNLSESHKIELITIMQKGGNTPERERKTITPTETISIGDKEYDVAVA